uniref:5'-3' exonuclease n=1 Tax=uncultured Selenomonas sp. TaxID=159275 RepID=UPI0028DB7AE8
MSKRFILVDGSSLLYRAFYALPLLQATNGSYTNAVYGFASMLQKLLQEYTPDYLAVAFDKGKQTFRNEMFAQYKGTRKPTPPELSSQIPLLHEFLAALGVPLIEEQGYEADDILGTLSIKAAQAGVDVLVVTGDRDALQLVQKNIRILFTRKGMTDLLLYDEKRFLEEYGFPPKRLVDMKGLMGDASDNIPGVPGIGPKTAKKLLIDYGSLEGVY